MVMKRVYKWDFEYLLDLQEDFQMKADESTLDVDKERYLDIVDEISELLCMIVFSEGTLVSDNIRQQEMLDNLRMCEYVPDYSDLTDDLVDKLIPMLADMDIIPNIKYKTKIDMATCLDILGNVILNVFDEKHLEVYNEYIRNKKDVILLSNVIESASTTTLNVEGEEIHYIAVGNKNNFDMFSNLIHEIGHVFRLVNNKYLIDEDDKLYEFEAYMYQIKILDYLIKNDVYRDEAITALLDIFKTIERVAVLIDASKKYGLKKQFNVGNFKDICAKINLYDRAYLNNTSHLIEYLEYIYSRNILNYIYSLLFVLEIFDEEKEEEIYNYVINNIGNMNTDMYVKEIFDDPITFNGLKKYKDYRGYVLSLIKKD